jgi:hypothetical protein
MLSITELLTKHKYETKIAHIVLRSYLYSTFCRATETAKHEPLAVHLRINGTYRRIQLEKTRSERRYFKRFLLNNISYY